MIILMLKALTHLTKIRTPTLTAVGAVESVTNVPAASYRTAFEDEFNKL